MSKYNDGHSIDIDSLTDEELKEAMVEWAEGDEAMYRLLWALYNSGIKTSGCHAGRGPYMGIEYDKDQKDVLTVIMNSVLLAKSSQVFVRAEGSNPFSGPNWYKPGIIVGSDTDSEAVADKQFDLLTKIVNKEISMPSKIDISPLLELLDFLIGKYSKILLRVEHESDDTYRYSIEGSYKEDSESFIYLNTLLSKLGFSLKTFEEGPHKIWSYKSSNSDDINKMIKETSRLIMDTYNIKVPTNENETDDFAIQGMIIRNRSLEEFNEWLKVEYQKRRK